MIILLNFLLHFFPSLCRRDLHLICQIIEECELRDISNNFVICLTIAEDKRFFKHKGIDYIAIIRALWKTINGELQGASTIEQQLVRTITKHYQISIIRKIKESLLAMVIARSFNKHQIIFAYLSIAYFGKKYFGLRTICKNLKINIKTATIEECTRIVSRLKYPNREDKITNRSVFLQNKLKGISKKKKNVLKLKHRSLKK